MCDNNDNTSIINDIIKLDIIFYLYLLFLELVWLIKVNGKYYCYIL